MRNNIIYHKEGDYLIPDLTIENDNKNYHIGKYGHLRLKYLKEHKRGFYSELIMIGQVANHLSDKFQVALYREYTFDTAYDNSQIGSDVKAELGVRLQSAY